MYDTLVDIEYDAISELYSVFKMELQLLFPCPDADFPHPVWRVD